MTAQMVREVAVDHCRITLVNVTDNDDGSDGKTVLVDHCQIILVNVTDSDAGSDGN